MGFLSVEQPVEWPGESAMSAEALLEVSRDGSSAEPGQAVAYSVYADSLREAEAYKWIESEKAGRDLGEEALKRWVRQYWHQYLRARLIEHLEGKVFWAELDQNDFGLLKRAFPEDRILLDRIVDRLRCGCENLEIIIWAVEWGIPLNRVRAILECININARRLAPFIDWDC